MNSNKINKKAKRSKRVYHKPNLKRLGTVATLTLKMGSNVDGMGGFA